MVQVVIVWSAYTKLSIMGPKGVHRTTQPCLIMAWIFFCFIIFNPACRFCQKRVLSLRFFFFFFLGGRGCLGHSCNLYQSLQMNLVHRFNRELVLFLTVPTEERQVPSELGNDIHSFITVQDKQSATPNFLDSAPWINNIEIQSLHPKCWLF